MYSTLPLSIIICTYNRSGFLKLALDSLTRQTVSKDEYEIVIIDDEYNSYSRYPKRKGIGILA